MEYMISLNITFFEKKKEKLCHCLLYYLQKHIDFFYEIIF